MQVLAAELQKVLGERVRITARPSSVEISGNRVAAVRQALKSMGF